MCWLLNVLFNRGTVCSVVWTHVRQMGRVFAVDPLTKRVPHGALRGVLRQHLHNMPLHMPCNSKWNASVMLLGWVPFPPRTAYLEVALPIRSSLVDMTEAQHDLFTQFHTSQLGFLFLHSTGSPVVSSISIDSSSVDLELDLIEQNVDGRNVIARRICIATAMTGSVHTSFSCLRTMPVIDGNWVRRHCQGS